MSITGAWRMESYVRNGEAVSLIGTLLLVDQRWSTLYFVPRTGTKDCWGSAESGQYELKNDQLTFRHELMFQGGGGQKLVIDRARSTVETCTIELTHESLTIHFPSGNVIHCRRYRE